MSSAGGRRHGRRDNGLHAAEYAVAGDVDPRVGEHLLDVLGLAGIAAYLQPTADLHPVTRTTTLPSRPIDRLYVDREHLDEAREFLDKLGPSAAPSAAMDPAAGAAPAGSGDPTRPGGSGSDPTAPEPPRPPTAEPTRSELSDDDVRDAWAAIVAEFDSPSAAPVPPWPVAEDVADEPDPDGADDAGRSGEPAEPPAAKPGAGLRPATTWRSDSQRPDLLDELDAEEDEGYEPPPPPPIPRPSLYTAIAVLAIAGGLVLCIRPELLSGIGLNDRTGMALGFCVLLAGFVTLVVRLRSGDDEDSDDDDGAVV